MFEREEWEAASIQSKKNPPREVPRFNAVIGLSIQLGGFPARKGDGESGVKTRRQAYRGSWIRPRPTLRAAPSD
ncbi:IS4 family transposase [Methylotetracoccus oryzae]|uniref:IS4 family transposase n=1 Tax=Methylotetracoccus oryzae TaxID=1919059 RepID=UPI00111962B0